MFILMNITIFFKLESLLELSKFILMNLSLNVGFGVIIRRRRKLLKITQNELAAFSGLDRHTVVNIEKGIGNPSINSLIALCKPLGLALRLEVVQPQSGPSL